MELYSHHIEYDETTHISCNWPGKPGSLLPGLTIEMSYHYHLSHWANQGGQKPLLDKSMRQYFNNIYIISYWASCGIDASMNLFMHIFHSPCSYLQSTPHVSILPHFHYTFDFNDDTNTFSISL